MKTYMLSKRFVFIVFLGIIMSTNLLSQNVKGEQFEFQNNLRINKRTGVAAAMYNINSRMYIGTPEQIARQFLHENKTTLGISDIADMKSIETKSLNSPD